MKKIFILLLVICILPLASCTAINELQEGYDNAIVFAKNFCSLLVNDDFENAKECLHPSAAPNKDRLENFLAKLEETNEIDFSNGFEIKNTTFKGMAYLHDAYIGSEYDFQFDVSIDNKEITMFFVVVDNDIGYGIFYFGII